MTKRYGISGFTCLAMLALPWLNPVAFGPSPSTVQWLVSVACCAVYVVCRSNVAAADGRPEAEAWRLAAVISACLGLVQYFGGSAFFGPFVDQSSLGEAYGNLRQRNQFATLCALGIGALFWSGKDVEPSFGGTPGRRFIPGAPWTACAFLAVGLAASTSRTGAMQILLLFILVAVWGDWRRPVVFRCMLATLAAFGIATVALPVLAGLDPAASGLLARLRAGDPLCASRLTLWSNVLHLIAQRPWLGWGWGELDYAHFVTLYDGPRFCDILDNAHNLPLHLAVELGVPVAVVLCSAGLWLLWRLQPWRETVAQRKLAWAVLAVILLHSMLEYPLWYGPFQIAAGVCVWMLWSSRRCAPRALQSRPDDAAAAPPPSVATAVTLRPAARMKVVVLPSLLVLAAVAYAGWDYHRISQIYKSPADRSPAYRENTMEKIRYSWLFRNQVKFAELTTTILTPDNALRVHDLALELLHFSPEARVVEKLIESAVMLGREDEARFYLLRFRAAFPAEHARWSQALSLPWALPFEAASGFAKKPPSLAGPTDQAPRRPASLPGTAASRTDPVKPR